MALISSIVLKSDKHEAQVVANGESYLITEADFESLALCEGVFDDAVLDKLDECATRLACIKKAFSVLALGDMSEKRLAKKLGEKFEKDVALEVAALMKARGYIDEYSSAMRYASKSAEVKLWGPARIKNELLLRGYERDAVNNAVLALDEQLVFENAVFLVKKKMSHYDIDDRKNKAKLYAYLQRMGYSFDVINSAVKEISKSGDWVEY